MEATTGSALPNLTDPEVSKRSLLLGFAYSLCADGSSGKYDKRIGESIQGWPQRVTSPADLPQVATRREIRDALGSTRPDDGPEGRDERHLAVPQGGECLSELGHRAH